MALLWKMVDIGPFQGDILESIDRSKKFKVANPQLPLPLFPPPCWAMTMDLICVIGIS